MQATIGSSCMNSPLTAYRKNKLETRKAGSSLALHEVPDVGSKLNSETWSETRIRVLHEHATCGLHVQYQLQDVA